VPGALSEGRVTGTVHAIMEPWDFREPGKKLKLFRGSSENRIGHQVCSRRNGRPREVRMNDLMTKEDREIKQCKKKKESSKIIEMREKIADEAYLDHAIHKIATDLSHYLTK
jgi:hypothetical protein